MAVAGPAGVRVTLSRLTVAVPAATVNGGELYVAPTARVLVKSISVVAVAVVVDVGEVLLLEQPAAASASRHAMNFPVDIFSTIMTAGGRD
jgi:hypothetical protein